MAKRFERQLDKATDSTLIDPNWDAIIECVDTIRAGEVPVKAAVAAIRKRYHNENPHIAHHALLVLEACMKNCGSKFHAEIATKDFMEDIKNLSFDTTPDKVKNKLLELLQCWAMAFKDKPEYKIVVDTHNLMKLAGFDFPHVAEADAMFIAESAPEWADGEECYRCRTAFGLITRKHHCRACGQIFCDKCSSKQSFLPQYGIEKPVRVCDGCYEKTAMKKLEAITSSTTARVTTTKIEKSLPVDAKKTAEHRVRELKEAEEDEINLAIALSQSEAEAQERERQRRLYELYNGTHISNGTKTNGVSNGREINNSVYKGAASFSGSDANASTPMTHVDPELARYLNRDYWQQRKNEQRNTAASTAVLNGDGRKTPTPTAPPPSESSRCVHNNDREVAASFGAPSIASTTKQLEADVTPTPQFVSAEEEETAETMEFCRQLREQVTVMDNRIRSNAARNRSVVNDTAIQSLFIRLTEMHAQVMARMNKLEDQRNYFESLQDNLAHIQEARQAVDALREDHERQRQARMLEEQRLKQIQMQQKVGLMRQKKHEMILHQRQMALLRFQQQEQEMQMKRMQMMGQHMQQRQLNPPAEMIYNQTVMHSEHPAMPSGVRYAYPSNAYVDQSQLGYGMAVNLSAQNYQVGPQMVQNDSTAVSALMQDPNIGKYQGMQSYGDQIPMGANVQHFVKAEVSASNYHLNSAENQLQLPASNTPTYSLTNVNTNVQQSFTGYQQSVEQYVDQQLQTDVTNSGKNNFNVQENKSASVGVEVTSPVMPTGIEQGSHLMQAFSPFTTPTGIIMQQHPAQSMQYPVHVQVKTEPQLQQKTEPADELLISFD